jgi:hypothetical protein
VWNTLNSSANFCICEVTYHHGGFIAHWLWSRSFPLFHILTRTYISTGSTPVGLFLWPKCHCHSLFHFLLLTGTYVPLCFSRINPYSSVLIMSCCWFFFP